MKTTTLPAQKHRPTLIGLTFTAPEIRTLHAALEAAAAKAEDRHNPAWFLACAVEVELEMQLRTDRIGVRHFLNGKEAA